jgi:hypothetical protein
VGKILALHRKLHTQQTGPYNEKEVQFHVPNLDKIQETQSIKPESTVNFFPRAINKTNITFSTDEHTLLETSLKYNLNRKSRDWIKKHSP